jgi:flagellar basal-body rod modification protein FlgD
MSITDVLKTVGASTTGSTPVKKQQSLGQEEFLKLMTTQMTHQDPTKPMDNAQFLSQMAQFGTVSGIQDLQKSFKDFSASISSDQALQAASLVGRKVSISSNEGRLGTTAGVDDFFKGQVKLSTSSSDMTLVIRNSNDDIIATKSLGGHSAGPVSFKWDGIKNVGKNSPIAAEPGVYKVHVEANIAGVNTVLKPDIESVVQSVSMGNGNNGIQLNLLGLDTVNFNQVKQIL